MSYGRGFNDSLTLREAMNQLFEDSFVGAPQRRQERGSGQAQGVPVNIFQSGDNVIVFVPMPGLQPEDVEISVSENVLRLHGNKRGHEERHDFLLHEWTVGPYERAVVLPEDIDVSSARASFDNGVLVITFNKSEASKPRRIEVRSGGR